VSTIAAALLFWQRKQFGISKRHTGVLVALILGYIAPIIYSGEMHAYRFQAFYPLFFIVLGRLTWSLFKSGGLYGLLGVFLVGLFTMSNIRSWIYHSITHPRNEFVDMLMISDRILKDVHARNIDMGSIGVHVFTPKDVYDYEAAPLYYLLSQHGYRYELASEGNEVDRSRGEWREVVYLVCKGFGRDVRVSRCLDEFLRRDPAYRTREEILQTDIVAIYLITRTSASELSGKNIHD
jgi:hypothetical protein